MKKKKKITEKQTARYWETHDATKELDFSEKNRMEFVYQPPVKSISLRLPQSLILEIKRVAARMDVAYQALIKMWLAERLKQANNPTA